MVGINDWELKVRLSTRSNPKVPALVVVFQCALDFPNHVYTICNSDILATHSLENFLSGSFLPQNNSRNMNAC